MLDASFAVHFTCAGGVIGAVTSAWQAKPQVGQRTLPLLGSTFRAVGAQAGTLAGVAGVFQYTKLSVEESRGGPDVVSNLVAGCAAGSLAGFPTKSLLTAAGGCALLGSFAAAVYGIGSLQPEKQTSMQYIDKIKAKNASQ